MNEHRKTLFIDARIRLSDAEIDKAVSELVSAMEDREGKKEQLKQYRDLINGEIKVIDDIIRKRADAVRTGFEDRKVEVYRVVDARARKIFYYRLETDELVKSETAKEDDLQRKIDDNQDDAGEAIPDGTKAPVDAEGDIDPIDAMFLHLRANQKATRCGINLSFLTDGNLTRNLDDENICPDCLDRHPSNKG